MQSVISKLLCGNGILIITLLFGLNSYAQENIEKYVKENANRIYTVDPDSINYKDLQVIGDAIGDATIVMLGEQDHGDAPAFLAKTRLIKYLHEQKGFNVLAFEDDFFGLNYGWDQIKKDNQVIDSFIKKTVYPIWAYCTACQELFYNYIPSTFKSGSPLQLSGFDPQVEIHNVMIKLDSTIRRLKLSITLSENYQTEVVNVMKNWGKNIKDTSLNNRYLGYLTRIKAELKEQVAPNDFWLLLVDNLMAENVEFQAIGTNYWKESNTRDTQMAMNLTWLAKHKYANEKIIVWAHNYHVSKYAGHFEESFLNEANPMGNIFTNSDFSHKTYIIGFTSFEGTAGRLTRKEKDKVAPPQSNSFERWINSSYDYAFVDFKKFNNQNPQQNNIGFYMSGAIRPRWYHKNHKAVWNQIYDGVFFIRKMYPCEIIK
ncbi:erythromycin esterase family protein [Chitinophaga flava]|uniref:Erythromycin esterase n=1 Tax=Chitinophaga flava TaxID=2259036 RepID=A0A365XRM3_9BACT|nr:erythromycin esterase family protein [Chitinophaga flava]RBL89006.1 hypothetical protein DF182_20920 [Chitinophaga flava]